MTPDRTTDPDETSRRARRRGGRRLVFEGEAREWLEALPLGNGRIGAMCGGGVRAVLHLNEESVWSGAPWRDERQRPLAPEESQRLLAEARRAVLEGRPREAEELLQRRQSGYSQAFLPVGSLVVGPRAGEDRTPVVRALDLGAAVHELRAGDQTAETFVSAADDVLVHAVSGAAAPIELSFSTPLRETAREELADGFAALLAAPLDVAPGHEPDLPAATWPDDGERTVEVAVVLRRREEGERTVFALAIETTYAGPTAELSSPDDALRRAHERAEAALASGYERLRAAHVRAHAELFDRVRIDLGRAPDSSTSERLERARSAGDVAAADPDLVATLFDYGRYLLISSSRPGRLPANLQGLWNAEMRPPWSSNYTLNINTEMNCWAAEVTALPETAQPLIRFVGALAERGARTAAIDYGAPGWVAHHNSDAWAFTATVGAGHGSPCWAFWPFAGPWLIRHLSEHVAFGSAPDGFVDGTLRPLARGAAEFLLAWLVRLPDGSLGTAPSTSPENTFRVGSHEVGVGVTSTMDLALARELLGTVVTLGPDDDPLVGTARDALDALPEVSSRATDEGVLEWDAVVDEVDPQHRHVSHLYPLYPGDAADEAFERAAAVTLDRRGLDSTGWSLAWKTALWARLGRADRVADLLRLFFRDARGIGFGEAGGLYANLFAAHPPFQIDGNLGFTGGFAECLLQSHRGRIDLLPAVPTALASGRVAGLIARPGVVVDIAWADGRLVSARLRARSGRDGRMRLRWGGREIEIEVSSGADTVVSAADFDA
ncbi:glycoside hydrolase N-terminal domain-containing protein [Microbacterium barkeri]|uniref:glycosyl hydrolase family 95 catalytic domain-containing protein n=1 Tax=Microbacterium barkeri TaxID=33917 RepID=UPI0024AF0C54|nr:glycoside hydrolase N-terminal domain-containing protein [Microbacterium barkeri]MDI6943060.1 glycoside hydrolase N-terminal domain-containing protein [Microbacterium barkeri]